jgi:hypothetical protein
MVMGEMVVVKVIEVVEVMERSMMGEVILGSLLSLRCGFLFFSCFTCRHNIFPPVAPLIKFSDVLLENEPLDGMNYVFVLALQKYYRVIDKPEVPNPSLESCSTERRASVCLVYKQRVPIVPDEESAHLLETPELEVELGGNAYGW